MHKELVIKNHTISSEKVTICVPVVAKCTQDIINEVKKCIEHDVKLIELRADYFECINDDVELDKLLEQISILCKDVITLFTIRSTGEGGQIQLSDDRIKEILLNVSKKKYVDIVDVEFFSVDKSQNLISSIKETGTYVVASHHNFEYTYSADKIVELYEQMYDSDADILKIAMMPQNKQDTLRNMFQVSMLEERFPDKLYIGISMGEYGKISRLFSGEYGSCITFAALSAASAPGQIAYDDLVTALGIIE